MKTSQDNIKSRILIPLLIVISILLSVSVFSIYHLLNRHIDQNVQSKLSGLHNLWNNLLEENAQLIRSQLDFLISNEKLQSAWLEKDRDLLLKNSFAIFDTIRTTYRITHFYFIDKDAACFLRVHNPTKFGDILDRFTLQQSLETSMPTHGIELGVFGTFTLRVVHPWIIDGEITGFIELGMDLEYLTPKLEEILDSRLIFAINKNYLEQQNWEEGLRMMGRDIEWDHFEKFVVIDKFQTQIPHDLKKYYDLQLSDLDGLILNLSDDQKKYRGGFVPLLDAEKRTIGNILVLNDVTEKVSDMRRFSGLMILISLLVGEILFLFFSSFIGSIEDKLSKIHQNLRSEIIDHEKTELELKRYQDHLTDLVDDRTLELNLVNEELKSDIEIRKSVENKLSKQTNLVLSLFESLSHPFYVIDAQNYDILLANTATKLDKTDLPITCFAFTHHNERPCSGQDHPCPLEMVKRDRKPVSVEHIHYEKNNKQRIFEIHGYPIFNDKGEIIQMIEYVLDISERKRIEEEKSLLEDQLSQSQRLETIGELVDSVAHEINTPSGIIAAHADAMLMQPDISDNLSKDMQIIRSQIRRISTYTRTLLSYSKRVPFNPLLTEIPKLLDECVFILGHRFRANKINLIKNYAAVLPKIMIDRVQVEQVVINVLNNAVDANVQAGTITIDAFEQIESKKEQTDNGLIIEISDDGPGIPQENISKVFEPFFTTKAEVKGTGLGLAISRAIVLRHKGRIDVDNKVGAGAVFRIFFPV